MVEVLDINNKEKKLEKALEFLPLEIFYIDNINIYAQIFERNYLK